MQVGLALGSELGTKAYSKGDMGYIRRAPPGREGPQDSEGSHLIGLNSGREEAPGVGEMLLGPPLQQQGDLGCSAVQPPVGGGGRQGDLGWSGKALAQGPKILWWRGFNAPEIGDVSGQGAHVPGLSLHCEGHGAPLLGLSSGIPALAGRAGQTGSVRGSG